MKRTSFATAIASCAIFALASSAEAIDTTKTGTPANNAPLNQFNPGNLPGQGGLENSGAFNDPFLPSNIYNPFPSLPGVKPAPTSPAVPNPRPDQYPMPGAENFRVRIQNPVQQYLPPGQTPAPAENRWRLGVMSRDTDVGVQIHEVVRGSAASRAGLEPDDIIVAVHGYQVGIVNGSLFELSREFERHADRQGMVTMLVQDHRSRSLMNVSVQLDSRYSQVEGAITLQNNSRFPRNSTIVVELQEIVRQGAAPLTITRKEIKDFNPNQNRVPFVLEYDPAQVSHRGEYVLTATVNNDGRAAFKTIQAFAVNSQGYGDGRQVAMQLDPVRPTYDSPIQIDQDAQIATIVKWFNEYLGRAPSDRELTVWLETLQRGYTLRQVQLELLGHNQFFNRCGQDKETYITRVHQLLIGREPTVAEKEYWLSRYDAQGGIRRELAREFQDAVGIR